MFLGCHDFTLSGPGRLAWRSSRRRDARRLTRTLGTHGGGHSPTARQGRAGWSSAAGGRLAELPAAGVCPTNGRPPRAAELSPAGSWPFCLPSRTSTAVGPTATGRPEPHERAGPPEPAPAPVHARLGAPRPRPRRGGDHRPLGERRIALLVLESQHLQLVPLPHFGALFRQLRLRQTQPHLFDFEVQHGDGLWPGVERQVRRFLKLGRQLEIPLEQPVGLVDQATHPAAH